MKRGSKGKIVIQLSLAIMLICTVTLLKLNSITNNEFILSDNTVYTIENVKDIHKKIDLNGIYFNSSGSIEQSYFLDSLTFKSMKDLPSLNIEVDIRNNKITVKSKNGLNELSMIKNSIETNVFSNDTIYKNLLNQFSLDRNTVDNVILDKENERLVIKGLDDENIDIRILYMKLNETESKKEVSNQNGLKLVNSEDINTGTVVFKPEAIYGEGITDLGMSLLEAISSEQGLIWSSSKTKGVYQVIQFNDVIDSFNNERNTSHQPVESMVIKTLDSIESSKEIRVYFKDESDGFRDQAIEFIESLGYSVEISDSYLKCDLAIGYTWLHFDGIASSLDEKLNEAIKEYSITGDVSGNIRLMFRSAWSIVD